MDVNVNLATRTMATGKVTLRYARVHSLLICAGEKPRKKYLKAKTGERLLLLLLV